MRPLLLLVAVEDEEDVVVASEVEVVFMVDVVVSLSSLEVELGLEGPRDDAVSPEESVDAAIAAGGSTSVGSGIACA